eukprot:1186117-Prorocentrum_minimum.AAC.1
MAPLTSDNRGGYTVLSIGSALSRSAICHFTETKYWAKHLRCFAQFATRPLAAEKDSRVGPARSALGTNIQYPGGTPGTVPGRHPRRRRI